MHPMTITYREAVPDDAQACVVLRGQTRENAFTVEELKAVGVTPESWASEIREGTLPGYIAEAENQMAGYCFGDKKTGEIVVLALLPAYEGTGIGKTLLNLMVEDFRALGFARLYLGCSADPKVRSYGFYRHLGWRSTGQIDEADDEVLEYILS
ncbi:Acetyltransferase (GNAT) family protein [compost metagenome]